MTLTDLQRLGQEFDDNSVAIASVERHADLILRAAGSALRHYTMPATRHAILSAVGNLYVEAFEAGGTFALDQFDVEA